VLFAGVCVVHTRHAQFPYHRHPDEPGKAEQVLTRDWNFHHPMLLLRATRLAMDLGKTAPTEQRAVEIGRCVSAGFTAAAIVALSLLAFLWRGTVAMIVAGVCLALHHQLYELSHYMKEDAALLMGAACVALSVAACERKPHGWRAAAVGVGVALAISGKYIGAVMLLVALPVLWRPATGRIERLSLFFAALLVTLLVVNLPLLTNIATFGQSLHREMDFVVRGQRGMTRQVPHAQYWNVFVDNTTPAMWLALGVFASVAWRERRALSRARCLVYAFPIFYAFLLSFSPKSNDRYFLPATAFLTTFAAMGVLDVKHLVRDGPGQRFIMFTCAVALVLLQCCGWGPRHPGLWQYDVAFRHDDAAELVRWIHKSLPPDAIIASDNRAGLPNARRIKEGRVDQPIPQKVLGQRYAADVGTINDLRAAGVTHVAVSESDYGRFFLESHRPQKEEHDSFFRRKIL
jgi:hypothetical protein